MMPELDLITLIIVLLSALMAGFIDSAVGGGGMITVPTLFTVLPNASVPVILGTNKLSAAGGTVVAAFQYAKKISINRRLVIPAMIAACLAAILGGWLVAYIPINVFKKMLPPVLLGLLIYTLFNKTLGQKNQAVELQTKTPLMGVLLGGLIGLYDGLFGPGTGSFLALLWIKAYGFDFIHATAHAKWVNLATNLGSIVWFAGHGQVYWQLSLMMTVFNMMGALAGTKVTIKYGNKFVRKFFIGVVTALIIKTAYDAYFR
jgi:uncharacterized membrane protein YfcA